MTILRNLVLLPLFAGALALSACSGDDTPDAAGDAAVNPDAGRDATSSDAEVADSGATPDAGEQDAGEVDAGHPDAGRADAGPPDLRIPELGGPVEVSYDTYGLTHIRCESDEDCFAAQGYLHASHRFGQMDVRRRFAQGRLAEMFGLEAVVDIDARSRAFVATREGNDLAERLWESADARTRAAIEAYTRGVNAFLADLRAGRNGARLTLEWAHLLGQLTDWEPRDSVYVVLALAQSLTDTSGYELRLGRAHATLPSTVAVDAFGLRTASPATTIRRGVTSRAPGELDRLLRDMTETQGRLANVLAALEAAERQAPISMFQGRDKGSNNWVVAPGASGNGRGLLANDPHLGMDNPSVWYLVSLDSKSGGKGGTVHVAGASLAGYPGILLGQNEDLAWGGTVAFFDLVDVYVETLNAAGDAVIFGGQEVPLIRRDFSIDVAGGSPVTRTAWYVPHHGPVMSLDAANGTAVSIRWVGHDATTDLNVFYGLWTATTVEEARDALRNSTVTGQNWVVVDRAGSIGWFPYNRVPRRPWASPALAPWLPLPGDGSAEWDGFHDYDDLPQLLNPSDGFISTANQDMTGALWDGDPTNDGQPYWQSLVAAGYRQERIQERLLARLDQHDLAEMQSIQADVRSLIGERTVPRILNAIDDRTLSPEAAAVRDALAAWDFSCPTGLSGPEPTSAAAPGTEVALASAGCAAFHVMWYRLVAETFGDEIFAAGGTDHARDEAMVVLLERPDALVLGTRWWDDVRTKEVETQGDIVARVFGSAGQWLTMRFGADRNDWRWGRIHTVTLRALLFSDAGVTQYNAGPYANDGGLYTVDVANPSGGFRDSYGHNSGPSMRFACELGAQTGPRCTIELPGGNRHFRDSPFRDNLLPRWLNNEPTPFPFAPDEVAQAAQETVTVRPPE